MHGTLNVKFALYPFVRVI